MNFPTPLRSKKLEGEEIRFELKNQKKEIRETGKAFAEHVRYCMNKYPEKWSCKCDAVSCSYEYSDESTGTGIRMRTDFPFLFVSLSNRRSLEYERMRLPITQRILLMLFLFSWKKRERRGAFLKQEKDTLQKALNILS